MVAYPALAVFEDAFEEIKNAVSVERAVFAVRDRYGLANVTYHLAQTVQGNVDAPYVRTTYPDTWVARYLLKNYVKVDPIVKEGFARQLPFDWSEVEITPAAYELMTEAISNGVGPAGYSMPVTDKAGRRALVSFNSAVAGEDWNAIVASNREHWAELAQLLHTKAVKEIVGDDQGIPSLGPRELEMPLLERTGQRSQGDRQVTANLRKHDAGLSEVRAQQAAMLQHHEGCHHPRLGFG